MLYEGLHCKVTCNFSLAFYDFARSKQRTKKIVNSVSCRLTYETNRILNKGNEVKIHFLTIFYLFSIPKIVLIWYFIVLLKCCTWKNWKKYFSRLEKKKFLFWKIFFLVGKIIFSIFSHEKIGKVNKIICYHNCPDLSLFE